MIKKIVSGGQTGADRGALDAAIYAHVSHGGWCPKGRLAEDGPIPTRYDLTETGSKNYLQRTEWNVRDTDCTLVFTWGPISGGTMRTVEFAEKHGKSCHVADLKGADTKKLVDHICSWLLGEIEKEEGFPLPPRHPVLNVAGPRESKVKGISDKVAVAMVEVLIRMNPDCSALSPIAATCGGVDKEQASQLALALAQEYDIVSSVTDKPPEETQWLYNFIEPIEPCWYVSLTYRKRLMVGGMSGLVIVSQATGEVVGNYEISGE